jgi:tRNA(Ile2) C34 agmatinyltransferase TiaS
MSEQIKPDCPTCGEELCRFGKCHECGELCDQHAEEAYERWIENYYGGDSPTPREREQMDREEAWRLKRP